MKRDFIEGGRDGMPSFSRARSARPTALGVFPDRLPSAAFAGEPTGGNPDAGVAPGVAVRNPQWFLELDGAMNRGPSLVAGPAGSEWRTRRPSRETNQLPRRNHP